MFSRSFKPFEPTIYRYKIKIASFIVQKQAMVMFCLAAKHLNLSFEKKEKGNND